MFALKWWTPQIELYSWCLSATMQSPAEQILLMGFLSPNGRHCWLPTTNDPYGGIIRCSLDWCWSVPIWYDTGIFGCVSWARAKEFQLPSYHAYTPPPLRKVSTILKFILSRDKDLIHLFAQLVPFDSLGPQLKVTRFDGGMWLIGAKPSWEQFVLI